MKRVRVVFALGLLAACVGMCSDVQASPQGKVVATVDSVKQGPGAGLVAVSVSWDNCVGIDNVTVTIDTKSVGGVVTTKTTGWTQPPALNAKGSWALTPGGFPSGNTVTKVTVDVFDKNGNGITSGANNNPGITVP